MELFGGIEDDDNKMLSDPLTRLGDENKKLKDLNQRLRKQIEDMLYNLVVRPDYKQHGCSENVDDTNNDGDVASGTSGPDNFAKLELPTWLKTYLKKNGWKSPGDRKVVSAAK